MCLFADPKYFEEMCVLCQAHNSDMVVARPKVLWKMLYLVVALCFETALRNPKQDLLQSALANMMPHMCVSQWFRKHHTQHHMKKHRLQPAAFYAFAQFRKHRVRHQIENVDRNQLCSALCYSFTCTALHHDHNRLQSEFAEVSPAPRAAS